MSCVPFYILIICAVYSTFLQRSYDQIIHDISLQNLFKVANFYIQVYYTYMQNITFTGISSLYTGKKVYSKLGPYITPGGILKNGEKNTKNLQSIVNLQMINQEIT